MENDGSLNLASTKKKIELIQIAIQQLINSKQEHLLNNHHDHHLLSKLLSQLEALKADGVIDPSEAIVESKEAPSYKASEVETNSEDEAQTSSNNKAPEAEVVKELKKLEKQNKITHWLLSTLILVTLAWQLHEVSLLLKLKATFTNPFKSVGNIFKGLVKRHRANEQEQSLFPMENGNDSLLALPQFELPDLVTSGENERQ